MGQHDFRVLPILGVLVGEDSPVIGCASRSAERGCGDRGDALRLAVDARRRGRRCVERLLLEQRPPRAADRSSRGRPSSARSTPGARVAVIERGRAARAPERQRPEQHRAHDREDRGVGADADHQRQERGDVNARSLRTGAGTNRRSWKRRSMKRQYDFHPFEVAATGAPSRVVGTRDSGLGARGSGSAGLKPSVILAQCAWGPTPMRFSLAGPAAPRCPSGRSLGPQAPKPRRSEATFFPLLTSNRSGRYRSCWHSTGAVEC